MKKSLFSSPLKTFVVKYKPENIRKESRKTAIDAQNLTIDPAAIGASKKRHYVGNIFGLAEAFQRGEFAKLFNLSFCLTLEEQICSRWARCHSVYTNISTPQLIGKHSNQTLNACLGSNVRTIRRECHGDNTTRESDNSSTG